MPATHLAHRVTQDTPGITSQSVCLSSAPPSLEISRAPVRFARTWPTGLPRTHLVLPLHQYALGVGPHYSPIPTQGKKVGAAKLRGERRPATHSWTAAPFQHRAQGGPAKLGGEGCLSTHSWTTPPLQHGAQGGPGTPRGSGTCPPVCGHTPFPKSPLKVNKIPYNQAPEPARGREAREGQPEWVGAEGQSPQGPMSPRIKKRVQGRHPQRAVGSPVPPMSQAATPPPPGRARPTPSRQGGRPMPHGRRGVDSFVHRGQTAPLFAC